jgi:DNA/RNA endonuclease G (NUC1)
MKGGRWGWIALAILLSCSSAFAADRHCTKEEKEAADKVLWLSPADKKLAAQRHLPWGVPRPTQPVAHEALLAHRDYVINYDADLLVPIWTAHRLDFKRLGKSGRINCFRRDVRINAPGASLPADYEEPTFDQGHMTPNGDMSHSEKAVINSFIMSNMTPQFCQFNRGVWQILESIVRLWAHDAGTVYVMTGSVFDRNEDGRRDADNQATRMKSNSGKIRVAVPSHFYKIVIRKGAGGRLESIAILLPHDQTDLDGAPALAYLADNIRPIAEVEKVAGVKLLPGMRVQLHEATKGNPWQYTGKASDSLVFDDCRRTLIARQPR